MHFLTQVNGERMSKTHKIKQVIKSTKKTAVITKAMQVVSASKLPNTQIRLNHATPFADLTSTVMSHYAKSASHPYFKVRGKHKKEGLIVISSDRGLCGNLNISLFKQVAILLQQKHKQGVGMLLSTIGTKANQFFDSKVTVLSSKEGLGDKPNLSDIMNVIHPMIAAFDNNELDSIHIASNTYISTLSQQAEIHQLLPLAESAQTTPKSDYTYEPSLDKVLDTLLRYYVESTCYRKVIENITCEQAARMIAMKNATDNANEIIEDLNLTYNKARQASITQEIAEIAASAHHSDGEAS